MLASPVLNMPVVRIKRKKCSGLVKYFERRERQLTAIRVRIVATIILINVVMVIPDDNVLSSSA